MNLTQEIKAIEANLGYSYKGIKNDSYCFLMLYPGQDYSHYHYYIVTSCTHCSKPYLKRKYIKTKMHKHCALKVLNEKKTLRSNLSRARGRK
jgi:hypothetical protein